MTPQWQILIVDDDKPVCESLAAWLRESGCAVATAANGREALEKSAKHDYAIYFVDVQTPGGADGAETTRQICKLHPNAYIVIMTEHATLEDAIKALKDGAQEYLIKPCRKDEVTLFVGRILKIKNLERENCILRSQLMSVYAAQELVGNSPKMQAIAEMARELASLPHPVLIHGEEGIEKTVIARTIHYSGDRASKPFVVVSCAALRKFEPVPGSTIFLDGVEDLSRQLQEDLLFVLQGGALRVIAATNIDLRDAVAAGQFREDLLTRLARAEIHVPPLRERSEDIPVLAAHFMEHMARELGRDVRRISDDALRVLMDHDWPGNVRELQNAIERAVLSCRGRELLAEDFSFLTRQAEATQHWNVPAGASLPEMERVVITATLGRAGGNIKESARILGIDRSTLYEKIKKYGIPR